MTGSKRLALVVSALALAGSGLGCNPTRATPGGHTDAGHTTVGRDSGAASACTSASDSDHNGIADSLEDPANPDDDADTITDVVENMAATNPCAPSDCDGDGTPNFRDLDSDNDGVPDQQEVANGTDECNSDTDGDGVTDLVELAAGTNGNDRTSQPPSGTLYVTIPYYPPGTMGTHPHQQFDFETRIQLADVFILVDNSNSMDSVIAAIRGPFSSTIVPGIRAAIPDVRIGVGSFDSVPDGQDGDPGSPGDYTLWVRQQLDPDATLSQTAFDNMQTIRYTSPGTFVGGDGPEDSTEALYESLTGAGMTGHENDMAARYSVHDARDGAGDGWVPTMQPNLDCNVDPDAPPPFGWACFASGRVPILVLASDAGWWNGPSSGDPQNADQHSYAELVSAMQMHGAYFIGIDVGSGMGGPTYANSTTLATATGTVDGSGHPVVFGPGASGLAGIANDIVNAVVTLAGETTQDITTRTDGDPTETRLPSPHTTADFIRAVTPDHAEPEAPTGYDHKDATTFYSVHPEVGGTPTIVWFDVDFYNDFQAPTGTTQVFKATIQVLGRARSIVDHRDVYMIVPPTGGTVGPQ